MPRGRRLFGDCRMPNEVIRELAIRDPLTGIFIRRYVWERMEREAIRARSDASPFHVCLIDLDHFKLINNTFGHAAGDIVLQTVAKAIEREVREEDCFGRYGGEEFILLLRSSRAFNPEAFAERIRQRIASLRIPDAPQLEQVTVSIGVARFHLEDGFAKTISRADQALYKAKASGRNRVVCAEVINNEKSILV